MFNFNWLKRLFGGGGNVALPEPRRIPPMPQIYGHNPRPTYPKPPAPPGPPNVRFKAEGVSRKPIRDDEILVLPKGGEVVYFYGHPIERSLDRPSAWPPLDTAPAVFESGKGGEFDGGGASGGWEAPNPVDVAKASVCKDIRIDSTPIERYEPPSSCSSDSSSDSSSSDSSSSSSD